MFGGNALKIVQNAVSYKNANEKKIDQYWVVFDKDETADQQFAQAIELAEKNDIRVAWSNQAFECWIILHFRDFVHPCHRNGYGAHLREHIPAYNANGKGEEQGRQLFKATAHLLDNAIERAKNGYESFDSGLPASQKQTSTLIYKLVQSILLHN